LLIIFAGLPGTGKSSIGRALARRLGATYLRIDSIELAIAESTLGPGPAGDAGYRIGYALAEDNLRPGRTVIADSVNPLASTRAARLDVARRAGCPAVEVEVICSDPVLHRKRIESRPPDSPGLKPLSWQDVVDREYHPWDGDRIVIDTRDRTVDACVDDLLSHLSPLAPNMPR